jgi:aspartyl protease family protein
MFFSGQRTLFGEVASWVIFSVVAVVAVRNFDSLKNAAHQLAGSDPAQLALASKPDAKAAVDTTMETAGGQVVELPLGSDGHYHADADINGRSIGVLVDTGATLVALTFEDAEAAGLYVTDQDFTRRIQTANGKAKAAPVTLDRVSIGDITIRDVGAVVMEPGAMTVSLLGMTFLNQIDRVDIRSGRLILQD